MVDRDFIKIVVVGIVACVSVCAIGIYGLTYWVASTYSGNRYEVTVTVQAVEHSTRFGKHTNVWVLVYGEQDITYTLFDFIDLEIGKTYKIIFIDKIKFTPLGFDAWGEVIKIEEIDTFV